MGRVVQRSSKMQGLRAVHYVDGSDKQTEILT